MVFSQRLFFLWPARNFAVYLFSTFLGGRFVFHTAPLLFHLAFSTEFLAGLYPTRATLLKSLAPFPRKPATIRYKVCMHSARMILYAVAALACVSPLLGTAFCFFSSDWKKARILGVFGTRESHPIFFRLYPYKLCLSTSLVHVQTGVCVWCQVAALRSRQSVDRVCVSHRVFVLVPIPCGRFPRTERKSMCGNVECVLTSSLESLWSVVNLAITSEQLAVRAS
jgi:hypothetical protein